MEDFFFPPSGHSLDTDMALLQTGDKNGDAVVCCKRFYLLEDGKINEPQNYFV